MDFDREYNRPRRPDTPDDFTDSNVQALVEGRRSRPLPRPNLGYMPTKDFSETADVMLRLARGLSIRPGRD